MIDGIENVLQRVGVLGHVELTAADAGHFLEGILIEFLAAGGNDAAIGERDHVDPGGANGDGVNLNAKGGGKAGGVLGAEFSGVVGSVCE